MIHSLPFASCYVYSPRGAGTASRLSRQLRALLKSGDADFIAHSLRRPRETAGGGYVGLCWDT